MVAYVWHTPEGLSPPYIQNAVKGVMFILFCNQMRDCNKKRQAVLIIYSMCRIKRLASLSGAAMRNVIT